MKFDINTNELIELTHKLDKMHKSVLPRAARNTLNTLAFDTKKKTLPKEAAKTFTQRNPSFYRRFSRVQKAEGYDINRMQSKAGMTSSAFGKSSEQAGRNQKQQQIGGKIGGRTFIPLDSARAGGSNTRNVQRKNRLSQITISLDSRQSKGSGPKERFVKTAITAIERFGNNAIIKHKNESGKEYLFRVTKGGSDIRTREFGIKVTPLYSVKSGRKVSVKGKPFTYRAALTAARNRNKIYKEHAQREFSRMRKR